MEEIYKVMKPIINDYLEGRENIKLAIVGHPRSGKTSFLNGVLAILGKNGVRFDNVLIVSNTADRQPLYQNILNAGGLSPQHSIVKTLPQISEFKELLSHHPPEEPDYKKQKNNAHQAISTSSATGTLDVSNLIIIDDAAADFFGSKTFNEHIWQGSHIKCNYIIIVHELGTIKKVGVRGTFNIFIMTKARPSNKEIMLNGAVYSDKGEQLKQCIDRYPHWGLSESGGDVRHVIVTPRECLGYPITILPIPLFPPYTDIYTSRSKYIKACLRDSLQNDPATVVY